MYLAIPTESLRLVVKIGPMLMCDQINAVIEKGTSSLKDEHFDALV